jgi:integrase
VALERLQKFALENNLLDKPVFGILEKPRVGSIYSALWQSGARPGELCRATIADVDRANRVITLKSTRRPARRGLRLPCVPKRAPKSMVRGTALFGETGTIWPEKSFGKKDQQPESA